MNTQHEHTFYRALEDIFLGAQIEGDSGYVNLLKTKASYYQVILAQFKKEVDAEPVLADAFREEFFDRLYTFFEKYFSESGSVYFAKTAHWQRVYERVYTDNKDVVLFWKTHMLYYVKSDILFQSIGVEVPDEVSARTYRFYFDVGDLQAKQNNEKKSLVFTFKEKKRLKTDTDVVKGEKGEETHVFTVAYSERGVKTKVEDMVKETKVPEAILEKAFATFRKQSEVDFFINKDAETFLSEQLDMYLHQILLAEENVFDQARLTQIKIIKTFAQKVIRFIAQFENELVRVWNKPKFAIRSNYVITLDKLSPALIAKCAKHAGMKAQVAEWVDFGMVEKGFDFKTRNDTHAYLPLDTKHFKDVELEILGLFDHLDDALDGRLIHSENYQALNTLKERYKEKVQCVYIDPPYNTKNEEFVYVDGYKSSSWMSFIENRIMLAKHLLQNGKKIHVSIDDNELTSLNFLLRDIFEKDNYIGNITWEKRTKSQNTETAKSKFQSKIEYIQVYSKQIKGDDFKLKIAGMKNYPFKDDVSEYRLHPIEEMSASGMRGRKTMQFSIIGVKPRKGFQWKVGKTYVQTLADEGRIKKEKNKLFVIVRPVHEVGEKYSPYWSHFFNKEMYGTAEKGLAEIKEMGLGNEIDTVKPLGLIRKIIFHSTSHGDTILDFFAGSGTTAHALMLQDIDEGIRRKYILIEMGSHFNNVILPRIKKLCFSENWKDGKAQEGKGISHFVKYYALEQYEDTLRNMRYKTTSPTDIFDTRKPFENYVFYADQKFAHVLKVHKDDFDIHLDKLYPHIDLAETISHIKGLPIRKITKTGVLLEGEEKEIKTDYTHMTEKEKMELIKLLKPLLWWGE